MQAESRQIPATDNTTPSAICSYNQPGPPGTGILLDRSPLATWHRWLIHPPLSTFLSLALPPPRLLHPYPLQAEETKVLRLHLELSQAKGDMERRLQEKEEEFEAAR